MQFIRMFFKACSVSDISITTLLVLFISLYVQWNLLVFTILLKRLW
jgi:hypothetical protein